MSGAAPDGGSSSERATVALETSSRSPSVAAALGDRRRSRALSAGASHAADLLGVLDGLLRELGADPRRVGRVFVGLGPGSYTGLRVGIAMALGLARAADAVLMGVPSGEALAWGALEVGERCVHLLDARQEELYLARYARAADDVEVLEAARVVPRADLAAQLVGAEPILGEEAVAPLLDEAARARLVLGRVPDAAALLELGALRLARHGAHAPEQLEPLYLRPFRARVRRR